MVLVAGIVYTYIGLVFLYLFLRDFFNHRVSLITVVLIFLATNVFFYSVLLGAGMSHVYSFAMVSVYLYFSNRFIKTQSLKYLILLGVPFALAVLIRPTNIISGLYLFLFGVYNAASFRERWWFWVSNYKSVLILLLIGFVVFIPQMAYWHYVTDKFLVYSYQDYGFPNWTSPKIGVVLFGKYNGWFTFTPLMILAVTGLILQVKKRQMNSWAVLLIIVLCIYVNGSWWWPTFGAAVGQRAMIDYLPFMAAPLALGVQKSKDYSENTRVFLGILILIFIYYNIQFGFRYNPGEWWDTPMSWSKFFDVLKF
jgi:MFS family permease